MSKLVLHLPKILRDILELEQICLVEDVELNNIDKGISQIYSETVVDDSTLMGIERYEKIFGIIPDAGDSISIRKFRIKSILQNKLPYTERWLKNKLTEITGSESGWTLSINYDNYTVTIVLSGLDTELMGVVQKQLRNAIPSNLVLEIGGEALSSSDILYGIGVYLGYKIKINSSYTV